MARAKGDRQMEQTERHTRAVQELIEQARTLAAEYGDEVAAAVKAATEEPLDPERARQLYTRVIKILRAAEGVDVEGDATVAEQIRREVDEIVSSTKRPRAKDTRANSKGPGFV